VSARPSRRTVLRGAGVALALPWLESLAPRAARGQAAAAARTFIAMSFPEGTTRWWKPAAPGSGDGWALSPILAPLANVKPYVNVLANVGNYGPFGGHVEPSNSNLNAALLTCTKAVLNQPTAPLTVGTSVDQVIAQAFPRRTSLDSLQVGLSTLDSYTDGLPGPCSRSISWRSPTDPTYKLIDPQAVFDRITAAGGTTPAEGDAFSFARRAKNKSVLDYVLGHAATVRAQVGRSDRPRVDQYLDSVRALETSIQALPSASCVVGARPTQSFAVGRTPPDYNRNTHADLMIDLVVMALTCDVTRVVSFMLDDARSDFIYNFLQMRQFTADGSTPYPGVAPVAGLDGLGHAGDDNDGHSTLTFWFVQKLARLAEKLLACPTATGTMLDDATIWFGSEMHGGNEDGLDLPVAIVGKGGGCLKTNQYVDFAATGRRTERLANVYLTILRNVFGLPNTTFGSGAPFGSRSVPAGAAAPPNAYGNGTDVIPEILA
jgi:hypothetical protein